MLQSVEGMKFICNVLVQATSNPDDSAMDDIVKDADRLVSCLANKVIIVQRSQLCPFLTCYELSGLLCVASLKVKIALCSVISAAGCQDI